MAWVDVEASNYIVVLTASRTEFRAIRAHGLRLKTWNKLKFSTLGGDAVTLQRFSSNEYTVLVALAPGGRRIADILVQVLLRYNPSLVIFSGVSGGLLKNEGCLGKVILGDPIIDMRTAVDLADFKTEYKPVVIECSDITKNIWTELTKLPVSDFECNIIPPSVKAEERIQFQIAQGPIGSGYVLVKSTHSNFVRDLLIHSPSAIAIEMESGGCAALCQDQQTPYAAIRAISDHCDDKDSGTDLYRQPWAAAHAAAMSIKAIQVFSNMREGRTLSMNDADKSAEVNYSDANLFRRLDLRPVRCRGTVFTVRAKICDDPVAVSETECEALGLNFGDAIKRRIKIVEPVLQGATRASSSQLYGHGKMGDIIEGLESDKEYDMMFAFEYGSALVRRVKLMNAITRQAELYMHGILKQEEPEEQTVHYSGFILNEILSARG